MDEQSGVLAPVIGAYLNGERLIGEQIGIMRAYLVQWIEAPVWVFDVTEHRKVLILQAHAIQTHADIDAWLHAALDIGIDPL